jgi:hypothetical protein
MAGEEAFLPVSEMLTATFGVSAEQRRGKGRVVKRMPMLLAEESAPLQTILICRDPGERILIVKEFDRPRKGKRSGQLSSTNGSRH